MFSAVGYYFGDELRRALDVPIGLINCSWGGQNIESFTPRAALTEPDAWSRSLAARVDQEVKNHDPLLSQKRYEEALAKWEKSLAAFQQEAKAGDAKGKAPRKPPAPEHIPGPCRLFNGMIAPLIPFGIRGVIWYQGEANRSDGLLYTGKMKVLIGGWRKAWGLGEFPFLFVQLAPCKYFGDRPRGEEPVGPPGAEPKPSQRLPLVWQAQLESLKIPNTGMSVTVDLDGPALHPARKQEVGERLARWALANTYGRTGLVYSGPLFRSAIAEGEKIRLQFDHAGGGLASRDGKDLNWFEIAADDKIYYPAKAVIAGSEVLVSSDQVTQPKYVRYGWDEIAQPNLMNKEGLPASPFSSEFR